ncbi:hypothetical protein D9611_004943 [Ephemerocybe angulata]|uniref:Uncharacterized protein n=1 Tax=Ephemerocybe angulata TaxID=980116 RepID=A0A8H5EXE6_9AGAR|nr:hypothetical protein D9611_004943 [Tulosesus angulatus]
MNRSILLRAYSVPTPCKPWNLAGKLHQNQAYRISPGLIPSSVSKALQGTPCQNPRRTPDSAFKAFVPNRPLIPDTHLVPPPVSCLFLAHSLLRWRILLQNTSCMSATLPPGSALTLATNDELQMYYLVAYWVEAILFGVYTFLYGITVYVSSKTRMKDNVTAFIISFGGNTTLFGLALIHNSLSVYRITKAFGLHGGDTAQAAAAPAMFLVNFKNWEAFAQVLIILIIIWIGDLLGIYRCWVIWSRSYWVTLLPLALVMYSIVLNSMSIHWLPDQTRISPSIMKHVIEAALPINLCINALTTGLIVYRIWGTHKESREAGLVVMSGTDLFTVMRIIIESAAIYTFGTFVSIVLFLVNHPSIQIMHQALAPSVGIVFALIAIRAHTASHHNRTIHITSQLARLPWPKSGSPASPHSPDRLHHRTGTPSTRSLVVEDRLISQAPGLDLGLPTAVSCRID